MCLGSNDHLDGPCLVPPHPKLSAHLADDRLKGQHEQALAQVVLSGPTGTLHGLNDGTIFPKSQFQQIPVPSLTRMSRAALERTPLRGPIR